MNNPARDDTQSARDEEDREGELLCVKIKAQLEDLFSDSHLAEDGFLLKHVQRRKLGYVSLKLLTRLKKIKALTTNWYMTLAAAVCSQVLEVNEECTKVRRIEPLPKWLLSSPTSKHLLAWNIPAEKTEEDGGPRGLEHSSLSERILRKFSTHGSINSVWILHPGKELPKELQCYAKCEKKLGQQLCAVVKFDHLEAVRQAYSVLKVEEEKSDGEGMCVAPLGFQPKHHVAKDEPSEENDKDQPGKSQENPVDTSRDSQENPVETSGDSVQEEPSSPVTVSDQTPDTSQPQESSENCMQRTSEPTSCYSQSFSGSYQRYSTITCCSGNSANSQSPWVLRRKLAAGALKSVGHLNVPCLMQRVQRQPSGPDDTKGFRGRGKPLQRKNHPCMC